MKREVKIGLIQMRCSENPQANMDKVVANIKDCAAKGAQIISVSELFRTLYFCQGKDPKHFELAEAVPGPTSDVLCAVAKETGTTLVGSIFEKTAEGKFFNTAIVIGPDGAIIGKYHKMHIPSLPPESYAEDFYFEKGDLGFPVFETLHAKVSTMVCYDQWFPEAARISASKGAQILFYPTAIGWPLQPRENGEELDEAEYDAWQVVQRSHAIANNVFVAVANRTGREGNNDFWGTSFVADPYGRVIAKATSHREENLIATCDLSLIESMRKEWPFLEERRVKCEEFEK